MQTISETDFQKLVAEARILESDGFGPKVLLTPEQRVVKLFRRKHTISSSAFFPYAARFAANAAKLARLNVPTVSISAIWRIPSQKRDAVIYPLLPGITLRSALAAATTEERLALVLRLAEFCARQHQLGIHFRSLHLGNILLTPDDRFALIDIADLRCHHFELGALARVRNLGALLRLNEDRLVLEAIGTTLFLNRYIECSATPRPAFALACWLSRSPWRTALI